MSQLPITVPLRSGETLISYVSHLAVANGIVSVSDFCKDVGLSWCSLRRGRKEQLQKLSELSGVRTEDLTNAGNILIGALDYMLSGQQVTRKLLVQYETRVCARCVVEDAAKGAPIGRVEWQVKTYRTCHKHGVHIYTLPATDDRRSCFDFQKRVTDHWSAIAARATMVRNGKANYAFEKYLSERFNARSSSLWVDGLAVSTIVEVSERLGIVMVFGQYAFSTKMSDADRLQAFRAGFAAVYDGPARILAAFDEIHRTSSSRLPGFHSDFGAFSRWFALVDWTKERYQPIVELLCKFAFENYPFEVGEQFLGRACEEQKFMRAASAAKKYKIDHLRTRLLARDLGFGTDTAYAQILIDVKKYGKKFEEFSQCINQKTMADELGINETYINKFLAGGFIRPRFAIEGLAPIFHPDDIGSFLSKIRKQAAYVTRPPKGSLALSEVSIRVKQNLVDILELCLAGKAKSLCFANRTPSLSDFFVNRDEILDLLQSEPPNGIYKHKVRPFLRINTSTLKFVVDEGLLNSERVKHHRSRKPTALIRFEDVSDFLAQYTTLGMMSFQAG
ncbi:TniQ family protein [Actibacterium sp. 188UL27-1]|uniref:TniQ family protein n=1 Tax=Actibacterium sp. 188UL27-1 TaxID=2786961 RepID=UPI0019567533|nr:TniQ family protein [Actibacterium sp. 188UL27-1]MBM7069864.1 TniQ family protein [Actibacterium sp. 188UL27-1]